MNKLQLSFTFVMAMSLDPSYAQFVGAECSLCGEGSYVTRNCSVTDDGKGRGTKCAPCTNCTAIFKETLVPCTAYTNSVCFLRPTAMPQPTELPALGPSTSIVIKTVSVSLLLFVFILLALFLTWVYRRNKGPLVKHAPIKTELPLKAGLPV